MAPSFLFLLAIALIASSANCSDLEIISNGTRLEWTYIRNGVTYYMTPSLTADVIDSPRQRFNVEPLPLPEMSTPYYTDSPDPDYSTPGRSEIIVKFHTGPSNVHVAVVNKTLMKSDPPVQYFELIPVEGSDGQFHLAFEGEPFVSPRTRAPFDFILQSEFPAENPAIFALQPYQFHLNSSYGGVRNNIVSTMNEIAEIPDLLPRTSAYISLIDAMGLNNHSTGGGEIFAIGTSIQRTIPNYETSEPFLKLPEQLQLLVQGSSADFPLQLIFHDNDGNTFPMAVHIGINGTDPLYPLAMNKISSSAYFYTVTASTGRVWKMSGDDLTQASSAPTDFEFRFSPNTTDKSYVYIYSRDFSWEGYLNYIRFPNMTGFKFCTKHISSCYAGILARFSVAKYEVDVGQMYGENGKEDAPMIAYLIQRYADVAEVGQHFTQLVTLMGQFDHFAGTEVFTVASYLRNAVGVSDPSFALLPTTVQLIFSAPLSLSYVGNETLFPMKYYWASDLHLDIQPYTFEPSPLPLNTSSAATVAFDIMYGQIAGQIHRLYIDTGSRELRQEIFSGMHSYEFAFELEADLESVRILAENGGLPLRTSDVVPDFYFDASSFGRVVQFLVSDYAE